MTRRAVVVDRWDEERLATLDLPTFWAEGEALLRLAPDTGWELWADLFAVLDLVSPRQTTLADVEPGWEINHTVIGTMLVLPELSQLRIWTVGEAFYAAMACITMRRNLEVVFDRAQVAKRLRDALEAERARLEEMDEEEPERSAGLLRVEQEAADLAAAAKIEEEQRTLLLRAALNSAAEKAEEEDARTRMWSAGADGFHRMPAKKRLELAKRIRSPRFADMADLFGALSKLSSMVVRDKVPAAPSIPSGLTYGRDLARVLPESFVRLADPDLALLFLADYVDGALPMVETVGTEQIGRGGLVVCVDTSISMAQPMAPKGTRDLRAKAMALLLLHQAREQQRPYHAIVFSDRYREGPLLGQPQLMEFDFSGSYSAEKVLDFGECFFGGWTSFTLPLDRAVAILEAEFAAAGHTESDVVFITDGEAVVSDAWKERYLARMHRIGARTWGLVLAGAHTEPLASICEGRVASFDEITDPGVDLRSVMSGLAS